MALPQYGDDGLDRDELEHRLRRIEAELERLAQQRAGVMIEPMSLSSGEEPAAADSYARLLTQREVLLTASLLTRPTAP